MKVFVEIKKSSLVVFLTGVFVFFIGSMVFTSCSSEPSFEDNPFLGKSPAIEHHFEKATESLQLKSQQSTNMDELMKLSIEMEALKKEWDEMRESYRKNNPMTKDIPFKGFENPVFTIKQVRMDNENLSGKNLGFVFYIQANESATANDLSVLGNHYIYFRAIDQKGNVIPETKTVATAIGNPAREPFVHGQEFNIKGFLAARKLLGFAGLEIITEEEYKAK